MGKTANRMTLKFTRELLRRVPRTRRIAVADPKRQFDAIGIERYGWAIRMQLDALAAVGQIEGDGVRHFSLSSRVQRGISKLSCSSVSRSIPRIESGVGLTHLRDVAFPQAAEVARAYRLRARAARQPARHCRQPPRVQYLSSRSRWCAAKHADGYRETVYRRIG